MIYGQYGVMIFETDYQLRMFNKPPQSMYEQIKQVNVNECDRLDLEVKRLYHTRVTYRGYYNIYRLNVGMRLIYFVERYYKKTDTYEYEAFYSFEDAMAYIYG